MRLLLVCRIFTGMRFDAWQISSTPAVLKLLERLETRGIAAEVLLLAKRRGDVPPGASLTPDFGHFRHLRFRILPYRAARLPRLLADPITWLVQARAVLAASRRGRADVVYCDRGNLGMAALLAWCGRRVVWRCLGVMIFVLRRHGRSPLLRLMDRVDRLLLRAPLKLVIGTLEGSPYSRFFRTARQRERLVLLLNGTDRAPALAPKERAALLARHGLTDPAGPVFVSLGRLAATKHVMETLEAYRRLADEGLDFRALLVGYGELAQDAQRFVADHRLGDRVAVTGRVPHAEVPRYTAASDVYLALAEGGALGNVTLEALTAGSCIVTLEPEARRGIDADLAAVLPEDVCTRIARADVAASLADALRRLARDPALRTRYKQAAAAFAARHIPSWESRLDVEIGLLERVARDRFDPRQRPGFRLADAGAVPGAAA
jgi:glycosyltransferase involved in cell wall biosynthesis